MSVSEAIAATVEAVGLHYVDSSLPGIERRPDGGGFQYIHPKKGPVTSPAEMDRINHLAIPPAYEKVWICTDPKGHLQATGIDARGRKQYRYHTLFREAQDQNKFHRMLQFGQALPKLRECVDRDLRLHGFPKPKVLAAVVFLLERSLIRVGNEEYAKDNHSFGLTTMKNRHMQVKGSKIQFRFLGKSKIWHQIEVQDARLARIVKKIQDLPGQDLFHYLGDDGSPQTISSSEVNAYLEECTGEHFTAKDFRTWWGTVLALVELAASECGQSKAAVKRTISAAMKNVSKQLGNTPAICRKCYVHPAVVAAFEQSVLADHWKSSADKIEDPVTLAETILLDLLKSHELDQKT